MVPLRAKRAGCNQTVGHLLSRQMSRRAPQAFGRPALLALGTGFDHTTKLLEPYSLDHPHSESKLTVPPDQLVRALPTLDGSYYGIHRHCIACHTHGRFCHLDGLTASDYFGGPGFHEPLLLRAGLPTVVEGDCSTLYGCIRLWNEPFYGPDYVLQLSGTHRSCLQWCRTRQVSP